MVTKKIQLPREVHIGPGVIDKTGEICNDLRFYDDALVVCGPHTYKIAGEQVINSLESKDFNVDVVKVDSATNDSVQLVQDELKEASVILGVGGGKIIDVAKMASTNSKTYFLSVPTTASHDGITSPLASIKNEKGSVSIKAQSPMAVIADTNIIKNAPYRLLASGCGDVISNYTAVLDWKLAKRLQNVSYSESAASLAQMTAKLITEGADKIKPGLEKSTRLVAKALFSTGVAISIANSSRPASGSEHLFSHALDKIAKKPALHGEQCGVGAIMMMELHGGDWTFIRDALNKVKAPTTAKELGISPEEIIEALTIAHTIRDRYTILGDRGLSREAAEQLALNTEVIE
jgi:glycerol-1-phosphate dehydrogenase [NAD(P)+]